MVLRDHLEKLYYFFEVAKAGSFKEASNRIAITQPSITKSVQVLENSLNLKLFKRKPRGVELTNEGKLLANYCHQLFTQLNDIELKMQSPDDPMAGSIKVGTFDSIAVYFWPDFLKSFLKKYPKLNLELTTRRSIEIQQLVEQGKLDVGLIVEPQTTAHSKAIILATDQFYLYRTKNQPAYDDEKTAPLIFMPDALAGNDHQLLHEILKPIDPNNNRIRYQTSSLESAKEFIANGIGIGFLPSLVADEAVKRNRIEKINSPFVIKGLGSHDIGLVVSKHREDSDTLIRFIETIKKQKWQ